MPPVIPTTSFLAVSASVRSVLGIPGRRLKKLFCKRKQNVHQQPDQIIARTLLGTGNDDLTTTSINDRQSLIEHEGLDPTPDSVLIAADAELTGVFKSDVGPFVEEQQDPHGDVSRDSNEGNRSSLDTVIVRPREAVVSSETLSSTGISEGGAIWYYLARAHRPDTPIALASQNSVDFLDVPVFFGTIADVFQSEEGQFDHDGRDGGRPSRPKHAEEWELNLIPRAEDATSGLEHQAERENDPGSSSEEVQEEALDDSIHLDDDLAGQDLLPYVPRFHSSFRQANLSSPMHLYAKSFREIEDLVSQNRPFRSVGPWRTGTPFPNVVLNHAQALSGDTAVNCADFQEGSPGAQRKILSQDRSADGLGEGGEENETLIDLNAISPDVQWETVLESRQTSHENEMADLIDDRTAEMNELRADHANQVRRLEHKFARVLGLNKELQEKEAELCKQKDAHAEQLHRKDEVLQQVVANNQRLQARYEEAQRRLTQQGSAEAYSEMASNLPAHSNAVSGYVTELEGIMRRQDHILGNLHKRNHGLTVALAKDKAESDFNLAKVYQLTYLLEDKPPSDPEKDRLLEYKDKMYRDLDIRCGEIITALETTVQKMEKQAELDKACSCEEIAALQCELERKTRLNTDLQARKDAFRSANETIFDMHKRISDDSEFQEAWNQVYETAHQDNVHLEATVKDRTKDISDARFEISSLKSTIRDFEAAKNDKDQIITTLKEQKRALECDLGRLQIEAEILPTEHNEALADKDAQISYYKQLAEKCDQEKTSFIDARLDSWVRRSLRSKDTEISQLRYRVEELYSENLRFQHHMNRMIDIRAQDADYAFADSMESQLNKDRTRAAEEESTNLRKELADLREYHNPIRNKEHKDIEEVLQESEELRERHAKIESELHRKVDYLSTRLKQGTTWAHAVKDLGGNLLSRMSKLEDTLQAYEVPNDDDQGDVLNACYNSLLDFVEDETDFEQETRVPVPQVEQTMADFDEILAESAQDPSQRASSDEVSPTDDKTRGLSPLAAGMLPETPNTRAQRIIAEKERARGIFFDSSGRVKPRNHTAVSKQRLGLCNPSGQEEGDSFRITSSAWARRYSPTDDVRPSNTQDVSFF